MLPHETEVIGEIARKYRVQLEAMTALHDAVVGMMTAGSWTIPKNRAKRGIDRFVVETMMGLLTKACKTFRSIQILCERGLYDDANALVRVLMETTVVISYILQTKSKDRAMTYHAYALWQEIKMMNEWRVTKGLKRKVTNPMLKQANDALAKYLSQLPAGTNVKSHWSGTPSLRDAMKVLKGDVMYATLFRHTSSIMHAADFGAHFEVDPTTGEFIWQIEPEVDGFETPSYAARELLWNAANRIDRALGLKFSATITRHKLSKADVEQGLK